MMDYAEIAREIVFKYVEPELKLDCVKEIILALKSVAKQKDEEIASLKENGVIKSSGEYFKIKPGMQKGRIWIESTGGEGGDFDQDELFMHIREFYDKRF